MSISNTITKTTFLQHEVEYEIESKNKRANSINNSYNSGCSFSILYFKAMRKVSDLTDRKFGSLTPISYVHEEEVIWICRCDCGNTVHKSAKRLMDSNKKKLKMMCDECKLKTLKHPESSKLWGVIR